MPSKGFYGYKIGCNLGSSGVDRSSMWDFQSYDPGSNSS